MASVAMSNAPTSLQAGRPGTRAHWNPRRRPTASYCNPDANNAPIAASEVMFIGLPAHAGNVPFRTGNPGRNTVRTPGINNFRHRSAKDDANHRTFQSRVSRRVVQYCKPCAVRQSEHQPVLARTTGHPGKYSKPRPAAVCRRRQTHDALPSGGSILRPLRPR